MRRVINSTTRTAANRFWRTEKFDKIEIIPNIQKQSKTVYMYDAKTGEFLQEFSSIREAARITGYNRCTIQEHVTRNHIIKGKKHRFTNFKVNNLYDESSTTILNGVTSSEVKEK